MSITHEPTFPNQRVYAFSAATMSPETIAHHRAPDGLPLLSPGDILVYDFRGTTPTATPKKEAVLGETLSIAQWNIERGYKLDGILAALTADGDGAKTPADIAEADILLLQELDISCERSGFINNPLEIAMALKALCVYVVEFHELPEAVIPNASVRRACPKGGLRRASGGHDIITREAHSAIGCNYGFHGNAIVSRSLTLHSTRAFPNSVGIDWENHYGYTRREPRVGKRAVLTACVDVTHRHPQATLSPTGPPKEATHLTRIALYSLHQEIFCGPTMRVRQLSDAMFDASTSRCHFLDEGMCPPSAMSSNPSTDTATTTAGQSQRSVGSTEGWDLVSPNTGIRDFNTVTEPASPTQQVGTLDEASSPARTALYIQAPNLRVGALPRQNRHFSVAIGGDLNTVQHGITRFSPIYSDFTRFLTLGETEAEWLQRRVFASKHHPKHHPGTIGGIIGVFTPSAGWRQRWRRLVSMWVYGLSERDLFKLDNSELRLFDVFDKLSDQTINNPDYRGWVSGKLDWLLLSNLCVVQRSIGNDDYSLSDHKYLVNVVELPPFSPSIVAGVQGGRQSRGRALRGSPIGIGSPTLVHNANSPSAFPGTEEGGEDDSEVNDMLLSHKVAYAIHADRRRKRTRVARLALRGVVWAAVGYAVLAGARKVAVAVL